MTCQPKMLLKFQLNLQQPKNPQRRVNLRRRLFSMNQNSIFDEVAAALETWPPKTEEVSPLPLGLIQDYESVLDGDTALFDSATLYCPPRWSYTVKDLEIYARVVQP